MGTPSSPQLKKKKSLNGLNIPAAKSEGKCMLHFDAIRASSITVKKTKTAKDVANGKQKFPYTVEPQSYEPLGKRVFISLKRP